MRFTRQQVDVARERAAAAAFAAGVERGYRGVAVLFLVMAVVSLGTFALGVVLSGPARDACRLVVGWP